MWCGNIISHFPTPCIITSSQHHSIEENSKNKKKRMLMHVSHEEEINFKRNKTSSNLNFDVVQ